jgi:hypothetical protein
MVVGNDGHMVAKTGLPGPGVGDPGAGSGYSPLRLRDYVQIVNSILFLVLGSVILVRVAQVRVTLAALLVGGGLVGFGIYRLKLIWLYLQHKE